MRGAAVADTDKSAPEFQPGEADESVVSLSQMILAPLDAIFKAQVHAARSFLNFVLQLSYPHREDGTPGAAQSGQTPSGEPDCIYSVDFVQEVSMPTDGAGVVPPRRLQ